MHKSLGIQSGTKAEQRWQLLNMRHLPGRLVYEEAGWLLGFSVDEISVLVNKKMLSTLGNPPQQARKYIATAEVMGRKQDEEWLDKASRMTRLHWASKNQRGKQQLNLRGQRSIP